MKPSVIPERDYPDHKRLCIREITENNVSLFLLYILKFFIRFAMTNSVDPDQTAPLRGAV